MALSARLETPARGTLSAVRGITKSKARELVDIHLMNHVGDLTTAGDATRIDNGWRFAILVGNAVQGPLGVIGAIEIDAKSKDIRLCQSFEELEANADRLARSST